MSTTSTWLFTAVFASLPIMFGYQLPTNAVIFLAAACIIGAIGAHK